MVLLRQLTVVRMHKVTHDKKDANDISLVSHVHVNVNVPKKDCALQFQVQVESQVF